MPVIRMAISLAGENFSYQPGDLIMVRPDVAEEWIRIGHATEYEEQPTVKLADLGTDSVEPDPIVDVVAEEPPAAAETESTADPDPVSEPEPAAPKRKKKDVSEDAD